MANKVNISFSTILKRKSCIESNSKGITTNAKKKYEVCFNLLESIIKGDSKINPSLKINISEFMNLISNSENANKYFREGLSIVSKLSQLKEMNLIDENYISQIVDKYIFEVMPYMENTVVLRETTHRYNLPEEYTDKIINYAGLYEVADRILLNYNHISTRFNILEEIKKAKYRNLQTVVESCCDMIDTYKVPSYAKFNLCIEEMNYLLEKEGIKYSKSDLIKFITEYFLSRSTEISQDELNKYRKVLNENCYITPEDTKKVIYLTNPTQSQEDEIINIQCAINNFLMKTNKSENDLLDVVLFINNYNSPIDIKNNLHKILWLIWLVFRKEIFDNEQITKDMDNVIIPNIIRRLEESDITRVDLETIISNLINMNELIVISNLDNLNYHDNAIWFKDEIQKLIDMIESLISITYSDYNIESIQFVNSSINTPISLNEFKIFKFHNLIKASMEIDKFLKYKERNIYNKGIKNGRKTIKKIKDVLFSENDETLYNAIGEDNKVDFCIAQFIYEDSDFTTMNAFLEETCYEFNSMLECNNYTFIRSYYIINPMIAEIHLKESTPIELTDDEKKLVQDSYDESMDIYIENFAYTQSCLKELESYTEDSMEELLYNLKDKNLTTEQFMLALEALSFLDVSNDEVKLFGETFNRYRYSNAILESFEEETEYKKETVRINSAINRWQKINEDVSLDIRADALSILEAIMEMNLPSTKNKIVSNNMKQNNNNNHDDNQQNDKIKQEKEVQRKKNPFKGINLNIMKLYLEGMKKKLKDMSSKEKEFSRNIDNNFRRLVKAMKDSLISDRREAIIKGSVIPSFSRCIKICLGLAGIGFVAGNPIIPLMAAIGGFAASKNLTKKERILLLDEIETELDVVDKEISMAESKNQMKKYRTLLKYKKDLQRQYQRIRYNVRVGKDILPGSTSGIRNSNN